MDPPPLLPSSPLPALPPPSAAATANIPLINYPPPDSLHSSPRSYQSTQSPDTVNNAAGALLPPVPGAKLRLMCSYGGHIIPRPHDKSLCYVGGETRIVVLDRNSTFASLSARLSRTLPLNDRPFTLKYQLPNEDLDSLVSVATDEDLDNLIEEYDRITGASAAAAAAAVLATSSSSSSSPRIRLFLFFSKPVTAASVGDLKSESWFFDALNSGSGAEPEMLLPRNLSDTATMDGRVVPGLVYSISSDHYNLNQLHQDSPIVLESFSAASNAAPTGPPSIGSSCSTSPSGMTNLLPPIRVRTPVDSDLQGFGEGARGGLVVVDQDQFGYQQQLTSAQIQFDSVSISSAAPSPPPASIAPAGGSSEHLNRVSSEDDDDARSDPGRGAAAGVGLRKKPPLPIPLPHQHAQPQQQHHKLAALINPPPSPDSVASDSSIASAASVAKSHHQEQSARSEEVLINQQQQNEHSGSGNDNPNGIMNHQLMNPTASHQIPIQQQIQDPAAAAYTYLDHQQQQQLHFVKAGPGGQLIHSYYPPQVYSPHQQQQQHQQYRAVYVMPMPMQQQPGATAAVPASPAASPSHHQPPFYPPKFAVAAASVKPTEMGGVMYTGGFPSMVPGSHHQLHHFQQQFQPQPQQQQQQYVGYSNMQQQQPRHESMAITAAATSGGNNSNYGYQYGVPPVTPSQNEQQQMFYPQQGQGQGMGSSVMASHHQYQTTAISQSAALLSPDGSNQNHAVQQQQIDESSQRMQ